MDVPVFVATGNDGLESNVSEPACIRSAVAVTGAEADGLSISDMFNFAATVDLVAPGIGLRSAVPGGGIRTEDGTSMATALVTGSFAILRSAFPNRTADEVLGCLAQTGRRIQRPDNDEKKPLIQVDAAHTCLTSGAPVLLSSLQPSLPESAADESAAFVTRAQLFKDAGIQTRLQEVNEAISRKLGLKPQRDFVVTEPTGSRTLLFSSRLPVPLRALSEAVENVQGMEGVAPEAEFGIPEEP